jgi:hypothetical protein
MNTHWTGTPIPIKLSNRPKVLPCAFLATHWTTQLVSSKWATQQTNFTLVMKSWIADEFNFSWTKKQIHELRRQPKSTHIEVFCLLSLRHWMKVCFTHVRASHEFSNFHQSCCCTSRLWVAHWLVRFSPRTIQNTVHGKNRTNWNRHTHQQASNGRTFGLFDNFIGIGVPAN